MRNLLTVAAAATAIAACSDSPITGGDDQVPLPLSVQAPAEQFVPGDVLVKTRPGHDLGAVMRDFGMTGQVSFDILVTEPTSARLTVVRAAAGQERALATRLAADARVEYAELNYLRQLHVVRPEAWAFRNDGTRRIVFTRGSGKGQVVNSKLPVIDADEDNIEGYAAGGSPVLLGSIDTGVDLLHTEFLAGQLIAGRDWIDNDNDPRDDNGHGTHTTGTMAGQSVGVAGVSGAGGSVKVYVQRVCGRRGCPTSAIASAIRAGADQPGMVALNVSLGGPSLSQAERDAIAYALSKNVLVIASAGNDGENTVSCPACDPNAIAVGATSWSDQRSYYSNFGSQLDISAPGGELFSNTSQEAGIFSSVPGGYAYFQGTSMATPQVTGTAGIVASKTGLRGVNLRGRLLGTADNIGPGFGSGRLNSYRAVTNSTLAGTQ
jgi:subtilisin family serine protease